jgi:FtsP/CotA-like multicopper oxidase with cupredoxin domain
MRVVQTDGNDVEPVEVDEFRIGTAETYDVIVQPKTDNALTIFAQAEDRSGFARGTLAPRAGMAATVPPMNPRPIRTMADMGMADMGAARSRRSGKRRYGHRAFRGALRDLSRCAWVPRSDMAEGLYPRPPDLAHAPAHYTPADFSGSSATALK